MNVHFRHRKLHRARTLRVYYGLRTRAGVHCASYETNNFKIRVKIPNILLKYSFSNFLFKETKISQKNRTFKPIIKFINPHFFYTRIFKQLIFKIYFTVSGVAPIFLGIIRNLFDQFR